MGDVVAVKESTQVSPEVVDDDLVSDEVLIEEVSIDGMCGVY